MSLENAVDRIYLLRGLMLLGKIYGNDVNGEMKAMDLYNRETCFIITVTWETDVLRTKEELRIPTPNNRQESMRDNIIQLMNSTEFKTNLREQSGLSKDWNFINYDINRNIYQGSEVNHRNLIIYFKKESPYKIQSDTSVPSQDDPIQPYDLIFPRQHGKTESMGSTTYRVFEDVHYDEIKCNGFLFTIEWRHQDDRSNYLFQSVFFPCKEQNIKANERYVTEDLIIDSDFKLFFSKFTGNQVKSSDLQHWTAIVELIRRSTDQNDISSDNTYIMLPL